MNTEKISDAINASYRDRFKNLNDVDVEQVFSINESLSSSIALIQEADALSSNIELGIMGGNTECEPVVDMNESCVRAKSESIHYRMSQINERLRRILNEVSGL